jgi:hypothetical protein
MTDKIIKKEFRTDVAGTYIANIFADGHVETDPPNRPFSKEDLQRKIRNDEALRRAKSTLSNERGRYTKSTNQLAAPNAQQIARAEFDVITGGLILRPLTDAIRNFSSFATTSTASRGQVDDVVSNVALGGEVIGGEPEDEFVSTAVKTQQKVSEGAGFAVERLPPELRREAPDAN